jgi:hypothetical protein
MTRRLARVPLLLLALVGCTKAPTAAWQPVRVAVENFLTEPVEIASVGTTYGTFSSRWSYFAFPTGTGSLVWTPVAPLYSDSTPVPTDLNAVTASFAAANDTVVITNVVNGQTYFTPSLYNLTGVTVDVAIVDNGATRLCVELGVTNFQLAYYHLTATVALRVYKQGTACTGTFVTIGHATLAAYQANSGLVQVNLTTAP